MEISDAIVRQIDTDVGVCKFSYLASSPSRVNVFKIRLTQTISFTRLKRLHYDTFQINTFNYDTFVSICLITIDNLIGIGTIMICIYVCTYIYKVLAGFDLSLQLDNVITSEILVNLFSYTVSLLAVRHA